MWTAGPAILSIEKRTDRGLFSKVVLFKGLKMLDKLRP